MSSIYKPVLIALMMAFVMVSQAIAWMDNDDKVLLKEVSAITLQEGRMTTGRRSRPVPQLNCVGGSAKNAFTPVVIQCKNVGYDGFDVQWECKTDMSDYYQFGKVQVTCEGYDFPNDPYILKGSCGLEYTIEYTEAGRAHNNGGGYSSSNKYSKSSSRGCGSWFMFFLIVGAIGFLIYKMSHSNQVPNQTQSRQQSYPRDTHGTDGPSPPQYGFKPEYTQDAPPPYTDATRPDYSASANPASSRTSSETYTGARTQTRTNGGLGGFWTGVGAGGVAGYLFGRRNGNNAHYVGGYGNNWGSGWGSNSGYNHGLGNCRSRSSSGSSWSSSSSSSRSSGTRRTASGFGGTSRR